MQEAEQDLDTGINPTYEEVVGTLRAKLEQAEFQNTVLEITVEKLRNYIQRQEEDQDTDETTD